MKHQKKSNHLTRVILVLAVVVVVLVAVLAILTLGGNETPAGESVKLPQVETVPGELTPEAEADPMIPEDIPGDMAEEPAVEPVAIETPYITLYFPGEWEKVLLVEHVDGEVYTVKFSADLESGLVVPLFEIRLGGAIRDGFACIMTPEGEMMAVSAESYEFVPADGMRESEIIIVYSMQEAMNDVLDRMNLFYTDVTGSESVSNDEGQSGNSGAGDASIPGSLLPEETGEVMSIDTPGGTLKYPTRWSGYLHTEAVMEEPYSVSFYCRVDGQEDLYLFTVYIGGEEGMLAGSITGDDGESREVRLDIEELSLDDWAEEEAQIARAMQEDLNFVLENLE